MEKNTRRKKPQAVFPTSPGSHLARRKPDAWDGALGQHPNLDTAEVRGALAAYAAYRAERKLSRLQARSWVAKLGEFAALGPDALVVALEASVANGWIGVFPPRGPRGVVPAADSGRALFAADRRPEPKAVDAEVVR